MIYKTIKSSNILVSSTRTGKVKAWRAHIVQRESLDVTAGQYFVRSSYWQESKSGVKSKVIESEPYLVEGKSIGRSNETSAKEQAELEFQRMITKQMDKGYAEVGKKSKILPLPMLAQKFKERSHKIVWPAYVQPKLNGQRMLYNDDVAWSRGGKFIIPKCIAHLTFDTQGYIIDGELILEGNRLLQETMKAAKKYRAGVSEKLQYWVYDIVDTTLTFKERSALLKKIVKGASNKNIVLVPTHLVNADEVLAYQSEFTSAGFEGTMIRNADSMYVINQRSNDLQKLKDFQDAEFEIVDVVSGGGSFTDCAIFVCKTKKGVTFNCAPEGTMEYKKELYGKRKKLIGKWLTIRFQELTNDLVPQFPVGVDIRDAVDFS